MHLKSEASLCVIASKTNIWNDMFILHRLHHISRYLLLHSPIQSSASGVLLWCFPIYIIMHTSYMQTQH